MKDHTWSNWEHALLVCGKCSRKLGGGFGPKGKTPLAKALRGEPGFGKGRKARIGVAEVKCLGVCPKHAVTVVSSADARRWHLIQPGVDVSTVARTLLGDAVPAPVVTLAIAETVIVPLDPDQPTAA